MNSPHLLCIWTSKQVLRMPFAGRNQFCEAKTTFCMLLSHKMYKIMQKITKIMLANGYLSDTHISYHNNVSLSRFCADVRGALSIFFFVSNTLFLHL